MIPINRTLWIFLSADFAEKFSNAIVIAIDDLIRIKQTLREFLSADTVDESLPVFIKRCDGLFWEKSRIVLLFADITMSPRLRAPHGARRGKDLFRNCVLKKI